MPDDTSSRPRGRPRIVLDEDQVADLASRFWTHAEIAAFFKVNIDVIRERYATIIREAKEHGKGRVRDLQWQAALKGDWNAIKHLARHHLGEHDVQHIQIERLSDEQLAEIVRKRIEARSLSLPVPPLPGKTSGIAHHIPGNVLDSTTHDTPLEEREHAVVRQVFESKDKE